MDDPMLPPPSDRPDNRSDRQSYPPNLQAELAKERNRAAAERTLMAWIRTCLALISFGFGIDSIVGAVLSVRIAAPWQGMRLSRFLGLAFIGLGIYAMIAAAIEHRQELRYIQSESAYRYRPRASLGLKVAVALVGIGVIAFVWLLVEALKQR